MAGGVGLGIIFEMVGNGTGESRFRTILHYKSQQY